MTEEGPVDFDFLVVESSFFVAGIPAPGGSKRAFAIKKRGVYTGRTVVFDDAGKRNKNWRASVAHTVGLEFEGPIFEGPLGVKFDFTMPRLKSHFRLVKKIPVLRTDAPIWHTVKPDATKLVRSTEDALTGVLWHDDAQIVQQSATKRYGDRVGCRLTIYRL